MFIIVAALVMFWSALVAAILVVLVSQTCQGTAPPIHVQPPTTYDASSVKNDIPLSDFGADQDRPT